MKQRKYHRVERAKKVDNKIKHYEILVRPDKTYNAIQKNREKIEIKNRKKNWIKQKKKINWTDRWKKSQFLYCQQMSFIAFGTVNSIHYYRSSLHSRRCSVFFLFLYFVCLCCLFIETTMDMQRVLETNGHTEDWPTSSYGTFCWSLDTLQDSRGDDVWLHVFECTISDTKEQNLTMQCAL